MAAPGNRALNARSQNRGDCSSIARRLFAFYSPHPLPSPLGGGWVRKWIVMWWPEGKITIIDDLRSKRFGINRLRGAWLAKIFIALRLRLKDS